ncbi:AMP-binding protein [Paracoccus salsus]|uniref:AMP-binding protein n=1 Tax=Paracoccus salsus TaxID=2911061 RepID=UPI001F2198A7|nr:AMP-binding protein [Paracoccus salsus]MCF3973399.1 AMP-binding protein [Paracoccus salsus]
MASLIGMDACALSAVARPILDPVWNRRAAAPCGIALQNGYGMTRITAGASITENRVGSPDAFSGCPLPRVELRPEESVRNQPGMGEVLTRGPHLMIGSFRKLKATARVLDPAG